MEPQAVHKAGQPGCKLCERVVDAERRWHVVGSNDFDHNSLPSDCPFMVLLIWLRDIPMSLHDAGPPEGRHFHFRKWLCESATSGLYALPDPGRIVWSFLSKDTGRPDCIRVGLEVADQPIKPYSGVRGLGFNIFTGEGSKPVPGLPQATNPMPAAANNDPIVWDFLRRAYQRCSEQHHHCKSLKPGWLPSRLLHITDDSIRLQDTMRVDNGPTPYMALSYCWGTVESIRTTTLNMAKFHENIPNDMLPAVVKDAIVVAKQLRIHHIWIDRLCIQQDSLDDWSSQSVMMDKIFGCAEIVVCAVSSPSVQESFLGEVSVSRRAYRKPFPVKLESTGPPLFGTDLWLQAPKEIHSGSKMTDHLDARGWCFQESHFATRLIRYEHDSVIWQCGMETSNEAFALPQRHDEKVSYARGQRPSLLLWAELVDKFTRRKLTYVSDRLPALSGLASHYARTLNSPYLAGIWESSLPWSLLWYTPSSWGPGRETDEVWLNSGGRNEYDSHAIPEVPSWSWASLTGPIDMVQIGWDTLEILGQVIDTECSPSTANPFGPVAPFSSIVVEGPATTMPSDTLSESGLFRFDHPLDLVTLVEANLASTDRSRLPHLLTWQRRYEGSHPHSSGGASTDRTNGKAREARFDIVLLGLRVDDEGDGELAGLILTPSLDVPDAWTRVGVYSHSCSIVHECGEAYELEFDEDKVKEFLATCITKRFKIV